MQIASNMVVTIDYTLTDDRGNVLDKSAPGGGLTYLHGAENIIPGLESALAALEISPRTAKYYWTHARAWLFKEITKSSE